MRVRAKALGATAAVATLGLAASAASGLGGEGSSPALGEREIVRGQVAGAKRRASAAARPQARARGRKPVITQLRFNPIDVPPGGEQVAVLNCRKRNGVPVSGGAILPADGTLTQTVVSRFNPNSLRTPKRRFYVGARNTGSEATGQFVPTMTCAKRVRERR